MSFSQRLTDRYKHINSLLCVGIDPRLGELRPENVFSALVNYCIDLVGVTKQYALAYKANAAFFEQYGSEGYRALETLRDIIPAEIPYILDAKRGDIGATAVAYRTAVFDRLRADAVTVSGYFGRDSVLPFAEDPRKGVFVLCRTSNPSASELQDKWMINDDCVYELQAELASLWNTNDNIGVVAGATDIQALATVRRRCRDMWLLAPGIGAQGGNLESVIRVGATRAGMILINVSRGISEAPDPHNAALEYMIAIRAAMKNEFQ